jgi:hypothetical protein
MVKTLIRFALITVLSMVLTPYVTRFFDQLAARAPEDSFLEDVLRELSGRYASALVRSFGETLGELVLGSKG